MSEVGPADAVTVMMRLVGSLAALSVAVAAPLASVVPLTTVRPPDVDLKVNGCFPDTKLLLASRTSAVIVELRAVPGISAVPSVSKGNGLLRIGDIDHDGAGSRAEVAVTVIAVPAAAVPAAIVAVAVPFASVVAGLPEMVPAEDEKVINGPGDGAVVRIGCMRRNRG